MLYKVVLTFESVDEILKCDHLKDLKTTGQCFLVVLLERYARYSLDISVPLQKNFD